MEAPEEWSEREIEEDYRKLTKRMAAIETTIARNGHHDLETLARAGVKRNAVLSLLALAAGGDNTALLNLMRKRQAGLKSLSERMETLACEAKRAVTSPLSSIRFWAHRLDHRGALGIAEPEPWTSDVDIALAICAMPVLASKLKEESRFFGRYLRARTRTDAGIVMLLVRCWIFRISTGGAETLVRQGGRFRPRMDCLEELARLLTDAFEAAGKDRTFSADGLRKTFRRHGPRVIRLWLDGLLARSEKESEQDVALVPMDLPTLPRLGSKSLSDNH